MIKRFNAYLGEKARGRQPIFWGVWLLITVGIALYAEVTQVHVVFQALIWLVFLVYAELFSLSSKANVNNVVYTVHVNNAGLVPDAERRAREAMERRKG